MVFCREASFKDSPIGKIPTDWRVVILGDSDIAEIRPNKIVNNSDKLAFIPMELVPDNGIFVDYELRDSKDVSSSTYCEAGDLLLAKITPSLENGKQGIVPDGIPNGFALATTEVYPIVCKGIERLFLFHLLKYPNFRNILESSMRGTTGRKRVPKEVVSNLRIPVPPLEEQRAVVGVLGVVDSAVGLVDEVIAKTERLKRGLMQELLTKGIGHTEYKDTPIGKIPKEWQVVTIENVVHDKKGAIKIGPFGSQLKKNELVASGVKVYGQENIMKNNFSLGNRYLTLEKFQTLKGFELFPDDVLITMMGSIGFSTMFPKNAERGIMDSHLIRIQVDRSRCSPAFLSRLINDYSFIKNQIKSMSQGAIMSGLNSHIIKSIKIPLPPVDEQQKIVEMIVPFDKKLELEAKEKDKLSRIKRALMDLLLTGKVRIKED